jgi:hypothetical protein
MYCTLIQKAALGGLWLLDVLSRCTICVTNFLLNQYFTRWDAKSLFISLCDRNLDDDIVRIELTLKVL